MKKPTFRGKEGLKVCVSFEIIVEKGQFRKESLSCNKGLKLSGAEFQATFEAKLLCKKLFVENRRLPSHFLIEIGTHSQNEDDNYDPVLNISLLPEKASSKNNFHHHTVIWKGTCIQN